MKAITPGHRYELANHEHKGTPGQVLQFIEKRAVPCSIKTRSGAPAGPPTFETINDGTTNEEVLLMLLDRLVHLHQKLPSPQTLFATHHVELALNLLNDRTRDRQQRKVEGTPKA